MVSHASKMILKIILERRRAKAESEIAENKQGLEEAEALEIRSQI